MDPVQVCVKKNYSGMKRSWDQMENTVVGRKFIGSAGSITITDGPCVKFRKGLCFPKLCQQFAVCAIPGQARNDKLLGSTVWRGRLARPYFLLDRHPGYEPGSHKGFPDNSEMEKVAFFDRYIMLTKRDQDISAYSRTRAWHQRARSGIASH